MVLSFSLDLFFLQNFTPDYPYTTSFMYPKYFSYFGMGISHFDWDLIVLQFSKIELLWQSLEIRWHSLTISSLALFLFSSSRILHLKLFSQLNHPLFLPVPYAGSFHLINTFLSSFVSLTVAYIWTLFFIYLTLKLRRHIICIFLLDVCISYVNFFHGFLG